MVQQQKRPEAYTRHSRQPAEYIVMMVQLQAKPHCVWTLMGDPEMAGKQQLSQDD